MADGPAPRDLHARPEGVTATVESSENLGSHTLLYCQLAGTRCVVSLAGRQHQIPGTQVRLAINSTPLLFDIETGQRQLVTFSHTTK